MHMWHATLDGYDAIVRHALSRKAAFDDGSSRITGRSHIYPGTTGPGL